MKNTDTNIFEQLIETNQVHSPENVESLGDFYIVQVRTTIPTNIVPNISDVQFTFVVADMLDFFLDSVDHLTRHTVTDIAFVAVVS